MCVVFSQGFNCSVSIMPVSFPLEMFGVLRVLLSFHPMLSFADSDKNLNKLPALLPAWIPIG